MEGEQERGKEGEGEGERAAEVTMPLPTSVLARGWREERKEREKKMPKADNCRVQPKIKKKSK